jgi:hypothetical protein
MQTKHTHSLVASDVFLCGVAMAMFKYKKEGVKSSVIGTLFRPSSFFAPSAKVLSLRSNSSRPVILSILRPLVYRIFLPWDSVDRHARKKLGNITPSQIHWATGVILCH